MTNTTQSIEKSILQQAFTTMATAKAMAELYEERSRETAKYVHATSRGHEAIQIACGMQLLPVDYVFPYYRDDAMMLALGVTPLQMMWQLMARRDDPFSGGRSYYCHPSLRDADKPKIPHQSSATGMQAIPATGAAMGMWYKEQCGMFEGDVHPLVVCSLGDACVTEGEVSEAFQMAALKQLPILFLVQDNEWDISAYKTEVRTWNAAEYVQGIRGIEAVSIDGTDFEASYLTLRHIMGVIRKERRPFLVHARVPLLSHHTSGVRMEWYRDDLEKAKLDDPFPKLRSFMLAQGFEESTLTQTIDAVTNGVHEQFEQARSSPEPLPEDLHNHVFAPTPVMAESGSRIGESTELTNMVDCGIIAIRELMAEHPECLLYGQDVGARLGGVFREAATLAGQFGSHRVFNTPIQEAFIIGSTVGMSAVGLKPIVEVQFADYIWPGLNQLFTEVSRSCYLSNGKWPVSMVLRVPTGAYGSGGPYHSSSVETVVSNIKGIKVIYPSDAADFKGLLKAAYYDPNPVVIFEHKGLYWSKVRGTESAKSLEPGPDYILPFGKARLLTKVDTDHLPSSSLTVVAYGMGTHWATNAAQSFTGRVEVIDLRSLVPLDTQTIYESVRKTGRCLVITEEPVSGSFAQSVAARVQENCFEFLDAPVRTIGAEDLPAIPLNEVLEKAMLLSIEKVTAEIDSLLKY